MTDLFDDIDAFLRFTAAMRRAEAIAHLEETIGPVDVTKPNGRAKALYLAKRIRELDEPNPRSYDSANG